MIDLPLKQSQSTRWSTRITIALSQLCDVSEFRADMEEIDQLRDNAIGVNPNTKGRDLLFRYFAQIELLALHVPLKHLQGEFSWLNLFEEEYKSQSSVAWEKACVLYNLAAILSTLGTEQFNAQDYKSAYHNFSCSAGILEFGSTSFLHAPCIDVQAHTLATLSKLMLAQAQHCFYLKAKQGTTGSGLLAKLAQGAVGLYETALVGLKELFDESYWGDKGNIKRLETTISELTASIYREQAQSFEEKHKYGDAIACLTECKKLVKDRQEVEDLTVKVKALDRDNNLIYHERVPAVVPEIQGTVVAKALPLESVYPTQDEAARVIGRDLFEKVIPINVHEKSSLYSEMKAQFLRDQQEKAEIANMELDSALEYMDLPSSISRLRQPIDEITEIPSEVLEWSAAVKRSKLGLESFQFDEQRKRILSIVKSGTEPNQRVMENLVHSSKTDNELQSTYAQIKDDLSTLQNIDQLSKAYKGVPTANVEAEIDLLDLNDSTDINLGSQLDQLSNLVSKLHKIKQERASTLNDLREKVHKDDVTQAIIAHQDAADIEKLVFQPELAKFDGLVRRIDATIRLQKTVLNDVVSQWKEVLESKEVKKLRNTRQRAIDNSEALTQKFNYAFQTSQMLHDGSQRAQKFYMDLERQALNIDGIVATPPQIPPKPPILPPKPKNDGLSGYDTPSTYNPSMYR